jgi:hypothetical protein
MPSEPFSSTVLDRELEQEKSTDPSGPRFAAPLRLGASEGRCVVLQPWACAEHV